MGKNFSIDSPFYDFITKLKDIFILNIIWLVFSLPIFTMGASTTALYYVTLKMAKNEEKSIVKSFFRSFKLNFVQSTIIWLIYLVLGGLLATSYYHLLELAQKPSWLIIGITVVVTVLYIFCLLYTFPVLARYHNSIGRTIFNALFISIRYFKGTMVMTIIVAALAFAGYYSRTMLFLVLVFGGGLLAYGVSFYVYKIFEIIEKQQAEWQQNAELEENSAENIENQDIEAVETE